MLMQKTVQIPAELFTKLVYYFEFGADSPENAAEIRRMLDEKLDRMISRQLYTDSKSAPTPEEREKARREYLDRAGVPKDFRW